MQHPYQQLSKEKFWRSAVASGSVFENKGEIWSPKFNISKTSKIVAAGSCFAQHVGRWFVANDFAYQASKLDTKHGFSFATGNIYTPALMHQWLQAACGKLDLDWMIVEQKGTFFDPLLPATHPEGFASLDELLANRHKVLAEIRHQIEGADVFIFTLGLTEAWLDKDSTVYPVCPGTMCGTYDPERHFFQNFSYTETLHAMEQTIELVRSANEGVKFLLTVSPIPLTATASQQHVLPAAIYSKSVLRSVAGYLADSRPEVDYFPSFELITTPPEGRSFFEENRRTVTPEGVGYVMSNLAAGLATGQSNTAEGTEAPLAAHDARKETSYEEEVCEEVFLSQFAPDGAVSDGQLEAPDYCFVGDSHMGFLAKPLIDKGAKIAGGMIMNGSSWSGGAFLTDEEDFFVPMEGRKARDYWRQTLAVLDAAGDKEKRPLIVTNIGVQTRDSVLALMNWLKAQGKAQNFDASDGVEFIKQTRSSHLAILAAFQKKGYPVLLVTDPPLQKFFEAGNIIAPMAEFYEKLYCEFAKQTGAHVLSQRDWLEKNGGILAQYQRQEMSDSGERDWVHASPELYEKIANVVSSKALGA